MADLDGVQGNAGDQQTDNQQMDNQQADNQQAAIDYDKIQNMIDKGTQQKESAILKSYFQQQGMTEDEAKQAIDAYKADKASKAQAQAADVETIKHENETLKAQILKSNIDSKAMTVALDMGVAKNSVPYVIKMADMSKVVDEKGEIAEDLLKTAIEQVLTDVPALKASATENKGFVTIGADGSVNDNVGEDLLRKAAGLPPKK